MIIKRTFHECHLMVVEDEYVLAEHLCTLLELEGVTVVGPAASVADALRIAQTADPLDGAILDVNLGGELVFPVADALAARDIPFLFMTGYDMSVIPERYKDAMYYQKPIDAGTVAQALGCEVKEAIEG